MNSDKTNQQQKYLRVWDSGYEGFYPTASQSHRAWQRPYRTGSENLRFRGTSCTRDRSTGPFWSGRCVCVCVQLYACIQAYVYVLYMFNFLTIISLNREETLHTLELQRNIFIKKDTSGMGEGWQRETVVSSVWYVSRGV